MLPVINSIPELYKMGMTREVIIDSVVSVLRHTRAIFPEDVAAELNADAVLLRHAWLLLTGVPLREAILQWRVCQAEELISKFERIEGEGQLKMRQRRAKFLEDVAAQCGWNSGKVMKLPYDLPIF